MEGVCSLPCRSGTMPSPHPRHAAPHPHHGPRAPPTGAGAAPPPPLGARVLLGGRQAATVRYVGPVEGQGGTWVGIEYDEPGRGKHDGTHAGRRYFACAGGPATGSLVRLPKFLEAADFGRSLAAAARERYSRGGSEDGGSGGEGGGGEAAQSMYVPTAGNRRLAVELVERAEGAAGRRAAAAGAGGAELAGHRISSVVSFLLFFAVFFLCRKRRLCVGSVSGGAKR